MERYIGLDAHASSCTLAVVGPSGKRLGSHVVETNARALIEVLRGIPRNRHVCLEEGTLSGWLYEVLEPHVEELVVTGVQKSRGPKSDKMDAFGLAEQLRIGSLETRVYKGRGKFGRLGHMARAYGFVVQDVVRVKNRLKSVLRSGGDLVDESVATEVTEDASLDDRLKLSDAIGRQVIGLVKRDLTVVGLAEDAIKDDEVVVGVDVE